MSYNEGGVKQQCNRAEAACEDGAGRASCVSGCATLCVCVCGWDSGTEG